MGDEGSLLCMALWLTLLSMSENSKEDISVPGGGTWNRRYLKVEQDLL